MLLPDLDEKDWILLEALQEDARLPFAELARRASLTPPTAAERVRRMEDLGLIAGYHAAIDRKRFGAIIPVMIEVQVKRADYGKFEKALETMTFVTECHHVTGRSAFVLRAAVASVAQLDGLIGRLSQFGETTTSLILSTTLERRTLRRGNMLG